MENTEQSRQKLIMQISDLQSLIVRLQELGYEVVGPKVTRETIIYGKIETTDDLPHGWTDEQASGAYRLMRQDSPAFFDCHPGAMSAKFFFHRPQVTLFTAVNRDGKILFEATSADTNKYAFLGVRACDCAAIAIQDSVMKNGLYPDALYAQKRNAAFIIAVHCNKPGQNCFCASMGTGPHANSGYDIALTEVVVKDAHYFIAESGSSAGRALLDSLSLKLPTPVEEAAENMMQMHVCDNFSKRIDRENIKGMLPARTEHFHWNKVATRCLSCGNCTMVCPTCFCTHIEDSIALDGYRTERQRTWDSCFSVQFSYIHGGSVRSSVPGRYRQWLMHKLSYWDEQFGETGCVGCGRCITWCPVGIDITEEARAVCEIAVSASTLIKE